MFPPLIQKPLYLPGKGSPVLQTANSTSQQHSKGAANHCTPLQCRAGSLFCARLETR